ncbi:nucleotidyltransferase domain-containing protein [Clostridium gasigenes]|uniref:Nucleotidyltransferase domain-containing protein n=1 Tax=Clostridium gasigenes TaxID=94869 RepID=A0A1H0LYF8_9CLOT|nr:nucleotidyltransferase domain-containing protein [Clostridium gasigenes]MBB6622334.1 nucleotidyltransferase domain-containing protein [Clostridium gasigenes]SDO73016.1 Nucleotidyltransferase domain-containing protein [Clostridium gasigenes]
MKNYSEFIKVIDCIKDSLTSCELSFIRHSLVYGSVSKMVIHEESDIDLLLLGDEPKSIKLISMIGDSLDNNNKSSILIDFKYYSMKEFLELKNSNLLLKSIEKDCKELEELRNELLRFC